MGLAGDFLRDAIAGEPHGACCKSSPDGHGGFEWGCDRIAKHDCFNAQDENPEPETIFFYDGLECSEVDCGTEACCRGDECANEPPYSMLDPNSGCIGGVWQGRQTQCATNPCEAPEPEDRPEGCMKSSQVRRRAPGGYTWNTDLCQNAQFRVVVRPEDEWPADPNDQKWSHVGYAETVSVGPIRANENRPGVEPCRRHYGKVVQTETGYARMMMCGQHVFGDPRTLQVSEGRFYLEDDDSRPGDPKGAGLDRIERGYAAVAVGYRAPYWVEAHYHSHQVFCGDPL